ncbi:MULTISPECIES: phytoene desaturase family protein [Bacillaceae]|uniref:phytoene desaturase family protein n=1 Tax=Bacillaceae TaxID=186817 RepID=UPI0029648BBA|nr:NAD(P)/FAD-dependent oxidoreductase [Bacillus infantis]MDW2879135.1 NAD(P)/FAD-dependent oxidoreductase [Bacillus infantis]
MAKSVCIIGAGIGGLTAGALLANAGFQVTVLEKASTVGGSAGFYIRKGRMFPTGATVAFGLEEGGLLRELLNEAGVQLPAECLPHPMDVILPDRKISIFQRTEYWEEELQRVFFEHPERVLRFWRELHKIGEMVQAVSASGISLPIKKLYDLGSFARLALRRPVSMLRLARYALSTVEDLLKKHKLEHYLPFRLFLDAQLLDAAQTDASEAALLPSSLALTIYRKGSFSIEKGLGQISSALAERIVELGGRVKLVSPVRKIKYSKSENKWKAESRKCSGAFDLIINNSGISFGKGTSHSEGDEFSWGAFRVDSIVSGKDQKTLPFAYQIMPQGEQEAFHGPIYATLQESRDASGLTIEDEMILTISVHTDSTIWASFGKEEYRQWKEQLTGRLLHEVDKITSIKTRLQKAEAGTPLTYQKFVGKTEVGGFPLTVRNSVIKPKSFRTSLPGFYLAGEQVFPGPGTLSAALSGRNAARAIIKEH